MKKHKHIQATIAAIHLRGSAGPSSEPNHLPAGAIESTPGMKIFQDALCVGVSFDHSGCISPTEYFSRAMPAARDPTHFTTFNAPCSNMHPIVPRRTARPLGALVGVAEDGGSGPNAPTEESASWGDSRRARGARAAVVRDYGLAESRTSIGEDRKESQRSPHGVDLGARGVHCSR